MAKWVHRMIEADLSSMTGLCANCGEVEIVMVLSRGVRRAKCSIAKKEQHGVRDETPEALRARRLKSRYGISVEDWDSMLVAQSGRCDICTDPMRSPHTDHDHETGAVRALLCSSCNKGLGQFRDRADLLEAAIAYLDRHEVKGILAS